MSSTQERGFAYVSLILLLGILAGSYLIKDEQGVRYMDRGIAIAMQWQEQLLGKAENARAIGQAHENELKIQLEQN